jgi:hypothetical protein
MLNLLQYYFFDANHDDMLKYYLMAIEYGNKTAMKNLGQLLVAQNLIILDNLYI